MKADAGVALSRQVRQRPHATLKGHRYEIADLEILHVMAVLDHFAGDLVSEHHAGRRDPQDDVDDGQAHRFYQLLGLVAFDGCDRGNSNETPQDSARNACCWRLSEYVGTQEQDWCRAPAGTMRSYFTPSPSALRDRGLPARTGLQLLYQPASNAPKCRSSRLSDFITLMKPRVILLAVFTALVGIHDRTGAPRSYSPGQLQCSQLRQARVRPACSTCGTTPILTP